MPVARKYRLSKDREIKEVFSKGNTVKGGLFFIKFLKNDLLYSRIAVLMSKKVSKKATERNLIKRRIFSAVEKKNLQKNGLDVLIVALSTIVGKELKEIKAEMDKATKNIFV